MSALWMRLTGSSGEARSLIGRNLVGKVDTLIGNAENRLWRARVGTSGALAEILVGRSWKDLGGGESSSYSDAE